MFNSIPPIVKNLLILNIILFAATAFGLAFVDTYFPLYYFQSDKFYVFQYLTHMFMHGGFAHLFFNMFALFMFGAMLERVWGAQRFLLYYLTTGFGAALFYTFVLWLQYSKMESAAVALQINLNLQDFELFVNHYFSEFSMDSNLQQFMQYWDTSGNNPETIRTANLWIKELIQARIDIPMVGASGAIFGLLLAFGVLFPNVELMMLFVPIPIKAKYFVIIYGVIELVLGLTNTGSNIAHFAHLGGMLFGLLLLFYWKQVRRN